MIAFVLSSEMRKTMRRDSYGARKRKLNEEERKLGRVRIRLQMSLRSCQSAVL